MAKRYFPKYNLEEEDTKFSCEATPVALQNKLSTKPRKTYGMRHGGVSNWKSQSSTSTTSLAQLPARLAALPKFTLQREAPSICALPNLSTVREESEPGNSSINTSITTYKLRHCGTQVTRRIPPKNNKTSSSDTDDINNKCLSLEINDDTVISCLLEATVGSNSLPFINDTLEKLDTADNQGIVDRLLKEALNASNKRGKVETINTATNVNERAVVSKSTSDESNMKPVEEIAPANTEHTKKIIFTSDESNFVNDTPACFVTERKKSIKPKESLVKTPETFNDQHRETLKPGIDMEDIEDFFSKHFEENPNKEVVISPSLARKVNESSSEDDVFEQYIITNANIHEENELDQGYVTSDVIDCLNHIVDEVCNDLAKNECLRKGIDITKNDDVVVETDLKGGDIMHNKESTVESKESPVKLKFMNMKSKKKQLKNKNTKQKFCSLLNVKEKATENVDNTCDNELKEKTLTEPDCVIKTTDSKRKRKLYSPKDNNLEKLPKTLVTSEPDDVPLSMLITKNIEIKCTTPKRNLIKNPATSYKEIENERKNFRRRLRKSKTKSPISSPRTKRNNAVFDQLKQNINNTELRLADKNSRDHDIAIYNFSSDSEGEDFKKKTIEVLKLNRNKNIINKSSSSKPTRTTTTRGKKGNKCDTSNSMAEDRRRKNKGRKKKTPKREVSCQDGKISRMITDTMEKDLVDEHMRTAADILNESVIIDGKDGEENIGKEEIPKTNVVHELESMPEDAEDLKLVKKKNSRLSLKRNKELSSNTEVNTPNRDKQESPMPALIIEIEAPKVRNDEGSIISSNLCMKLLQGGENYVNDTTQNLLSDNEKSNNADMDDPVENIIVEKLESPKSKTEALLTREIDLESSKDSEKSIETLGKSPITAHGDQDEPPPCTKTLEKVISPRKLETEAMNMSMKDYFMSLRAEIFNETSQDLSDNSTNTESNFKRSQKSEVKLRNQKTSPKKTKKPKNSPVLKLISKRSQSPILYSKRKSAISPVNLDLSEDISNSNQNVDVLSQQSVQSLKSKIYNLRSCTTVSSSFKEDCRCIESETRTKVIPSKKMKLFASPASAKSVRQWFTKEQTRNSTAGDIHSGCRDCIENVLEKLDTTLVEIQQETSRQFVNMFVNIKEEQSQLATKRMELYKNTTKDILREVYDIVNVKLGELTERYDEMDTEFKENLKRSASKLIREDCKRKRVMVTILQEDVKAVLDHLDATTSNT